MTSLRFPRPRRLWFLGLLLIPLLAIPLGLLGQGRETSGSDLETPGTKTSKALVVRGSVEKVNPVSRTMDIRITVGLPDSLQSADDADAPTQAVKLSTTAESDADLTYPAGRRMTSRTLQFSLGEGTVSLYPFDSYDTSLYFWATAGGKPVPVEVQLSQADPLFSLSGSGTVSDGATAVTAHLGRAQSSQLLAVLMMVIMWALALSICAATVVILAKKSGLVWPAMGWMAATLFALAAFRNIAPGAPPIGSLLDYGAFFWAELLVAGCLTGVVISGTLVEMKPAAQE